MLIVLSVKQVHFIIQIVDCLPGGGHGITITRWRRQWCVLKEEHLYYYKTSFDREAGGVIEITGYDMSAAPDIKKPL